MWMIDPYEFMESLSWEERLLHYKSEVRYLANIQLKLLCESITDPNDPRIPEFDYLFTETISDSFDCVRDQAFDALIAYLNVVDAHVAGRYARDICDAVCDVMVDYCFARDIVNQAETVLHLFVQLDAVDAVLDATEKATKNQLATDSQVLYNKKRKRRWSDEIVEAMLAEEDSCTKSDDTDEEDWIEEQKLIKSLQCPTCGVYNCSRHCPTCGIHDCSCIKEKMQPYLPRIPSWRPDWD